LNGFFSGVIQYDELLGASSESDVTEIEKLQVRISPDSACNIQFSSGTTGQPKAAVLSHFNIVNNALNIGEFLGILPITFHCE
jgi:medium-chain acyl-CoA ligase, mitochondrial